MINRWLSVFQFFFPPNKEKFCRKIKDIWDIFKMCTSINNVFPMKKLHRMLNIFSYMFSSSLS